MAIGALAPATARAQLDEALGLGAGGASAAESDETPAAPASQIALDADERARLDARIERQLHAVFGQVEELSGVEVEVASGVVHLVGEVESADAGERARELASTLDGVLYVDDDTEVATDVGDRVRPTLERATERLRALLARLPLLGVALAVFGIAWLLARLLREWDLPFRAVSKHPMVRGVVRQIVASAILVGGVVLALDLLDATAIVGAVLGAAGLVGLAIGLAFRDIAENYLASVMLGVRRPFALEDFVCIDEKHEGVVVRLTTRDTVLMTLDGNSLRLPNSVVYKSTIVNYTRNPTRRFTFAVGIGNDEDLTAAAAIGVRALRQTPGVLAEPAPFMLVEALADSSVQVRFHAWMDQKQSDWLRTRSEGIRRTKAALDAAGVALPVPIHHVELTGEVATIEAARRERGRRVKSSEEVVVPPPSAAEVDDLCDVEKDDSLDRQIREEKDAEENLLR